MPLKANKGEIPIFQTNPIPINFLHNAIRFQPKNPFSSTLSVLGSVPFPIQAICRAIPYSKTHFELQQHFDGNFQ